MLRRTETLLNMDYNMTMTHWTTVVERSFTRASVCDEPRTPSPLACASLTLPPPPPHTRPSLLDTRPGTPRPIEKTPAPTHVVKDYMYEDLCSILGYCPIGKSVENIEEIMLMNCWTHTEICDVMDYLYFENRNVGYDEQSKRADNLYRYYRDLITNKQNNKTQKGTASCVYDDDESDYTTEEDSE